LEVFEFDGDEAVMFGVFVVVDDYKLQVAEGLSQGDGSA
jgi:hypothetical protein